MCARTIPFVQVVTMTQVREGSIGLVDFALQPTNVPCRTSLLRRPHAHPAPHSTNEYHVRATFRSFPTLIRRFCAVARKLKAPIPAWSKELCTELYLQSPRQNVRKTRLKKQPSWRKAYPEAFTSVLLFHWVLLVTVLRPLVGIDSVGPVPLAVGSS
jgi:hypothetical protein